MREKDFLINNLYKLLEEIKADSEIKSGAFFTPTKIKHTLPEFGKLKVFTKIRKKETNEEIFKEFKINPFEEYFTEFINKKYPKTKEGIKQFVNDTISQLYKILRNSFSPKKYDVNIEAIYSEENIFNENLVEKLLKEKPLWKTHFKGM